MAIEVYSATTSTPPLRTVAVTVLLFAATCLLAASMSWRRAGETLGPRLEPQGWGVSFRPPKRFIQTELSQTEIGSVMLLSGEGANLAVWRMSPPGDVDADDLCILILQQYEAAAAWGTRTHSQPPSQSDLPPAANEPIGSRPAVERFSANHKVVVRATMEGGPGYAISMVVISAPLPADAYRVFDLTCKSFEFPGP